MMTGWWQLKYFLFSPRNLGKISHLTNIFQMGWNHQLDELVKVKWMYPNVVVWVEKSWKIWKKWKVKGSKFWSPRWMHPRKKKHGNAECHFSYALSSMEWQNMAGPTIRGDQPGPPSMQSSQGLVKNLAEKIRNPKRKRSLEPKNPFWGSNFNISGWVLMEICLVGLVDG